MSNQIQHANDVDLKSLLFGKETSAVYQATAAHVETCQTCRKRLDQLSGATDFDSEAGTMLEDFQLSDSVAGEADKASEASDAELKYLAPSSNPEMLGRIGRYEVERVLGRGGMGVVFKGFDSELNRPVAIKVLAQHLSHSGPARQRFAREAKAAAAIVHEHVVPIHNVEVDRDTPFLVMPYVDGESLQARVDREGPLAAKELLRIGIQVAAGLQAAHDQGVIHRDIKPGNVLLEQGVERALVMDFGLAQTVDDATLTQTGILTGTPSYMSPEQATGKPTDPRSDLFSLGSVLYFMATGHSPFRAEHAMGILHRLCNEPHKVVWQICPELPDELSDVIDRLLEKNPSRRFSSANEVQLALQKSLSNLQHPQRRNRGAIKHFARRRGHWIRHFLLWGICFLSALFGKYCWEQLNSSPYSALHAVNAPQQFPHAMWEEDIREEHQWAQAMQEATLRLEQLEADANNSPQPDSNWQDKDWNTGINWLNQQVMPNQNLPSNSTTSR